MSALIPVHEAIRRVGEAIYAEEWIEKLTLREQWLLDRYVDRPKEKRASSSILPGDFYFCTTDGHRWDLSLSGLEPGLRHEVEKARDKREWRGDQFRGARDWLRGRGFKLQVDQLDLVTFEAVLGSSFPSPVPRSGAEGRPSSMHLVLAEFERRCAEGQCAPTLAGEAQGLVDWWNRQRR